MLSQAMRRAGFSTLVASFVLLGPALPCSAEWRRIDTPNFTVVGDVGARTLRDVAMKFEGFRETLSRVLTERATATAVPTIVLVFPSDRAFTPFKTLYQGKPSAISGLFVGRRDANYIAVVAGGGPDNMRVVFHEYAHLVVSNLWRNAPVWVNEGLAEFYSSYEITANDRQASIGRPVFEHVQELNGTRLLKLSDLLTVDHDSPLYNERNRRSVFYAQSWALIHLIVLGKTRRTTQLFTYLDSVTQGVAPTEAWQKAFGPADMERELKDYVREASFRALVYTFSDKLTKLDPVPAPLAAADGEAFLAEFLMQQERYDEALARLDAADRISPGNPRVRVTRALVEIAKGNGEAGAKWLMEIPQPDDWLLAYTAGVGLSEFVERRRDTPTVEQLQVLRTLFDSVRKHHAEIPNVNARLASMELRSAAGPSKDARAAIERARLMVPGREDYAFLHAQILANQQEYGLARNIIGPLMSGAYPAEVREAARDLMRDVLQLETRDQQRAAAEMPSATQTRDAGAQPTESPASATPASGFRPIFRDLKQGEQRIEGVLERIECGARGAATFHIRTGSGVETLTTRRMSEVEFITYRDDLTGRVTCGPLKSPLPSIVTWRADSSGNGVRAVVAIEFPPK
ncbi:MAG: tetratricopeptide repeat protein [Vicinamibacterales bacterium]